ncbi:hypothetical protein [Natronobacterium texcoconense]|uniref:Uncharacterized protein n=1 Tax=Natronobacterium texcoconense TaxID=1095778 RepID=A0A1H1HV95_NATTX|nr:hypothetical protein [Natronobacterium texcoconense]SDR29377.1 hypothetical protein SAMN04489842_3079 [Natronobacterium texcoconense]
MVSKNSSTDGDHTRRKVLQTIGIAGVAGATLGSGIVSAEELEIEKTGTAYFAEMGLRYDGDVYPDTVICNPSMGYGVTDDNEVVVPITSDEITEKIESSNNLLAYNGLKELPTEIVRKEMSGVSIELDERKNAKSGSSVAEVIQTPAIRVNKEENGRITVGVGGNKIEVPTGENETMSLDPQPVSVPSKGKEKETIEKELTPTIEIENFGEVTFQTISNVGDFE